MEVIKLVVNCFGVNTYILADMDTKECAIVDPGVSDTKEREALKKAIDKYSLKPVHLINTHMHIDHVLGNSYVADEYGLKPEAHGDDEFLGARVREQARMFGLPFDVDDTSVGTYLEDGDIINVGKSSLRVLTVPGHSPGSIALYCADSGFVLTGDALFAGSIGRTDLPGGGHGILINSIRTRLLTLPDDTIVYPGHGQPTTVGIEKRQNPYL